jgi:hypothetical protein
LERSQQQHPLLRLHSAALGSSRQVREASGSQQQLAVALLGLGSSLGAPQEALAFPPRAVGALLALEPQQQVVVVVPQQALASLAQHLAACLGSQQQQARLRLASRRQRLASRPRRPLVLEGLASQHSRHPHSLARSRPLAAPLCSI